MENFHDFDIEFLDEISKRAMVDDHIQLLLEMIAEMNRAINEHRPVQPNYLPMLNILMAVHGTFELDVIRFVSQIDK